MKGKSKVSMALIAAVLLYSASGLAEQIVTFEPVRAPSMGPNNAPVTIIEIADYM